MGGPIETIYPAFPILILAHDVFSFLLRLQFTNEDQHDQPFKTDNQIHLNLHAGHWHSVCNNSTYRAIRLVQGFLKLEENSSVVQKRMPVKEIPGVSIKA